jgi:hypothetical protein
VGDAFDVLFRANMKNMALLRRYLEKKGYAGPVGGTVIERDAVSSKLRPSSQATRSNQPLPFRSLAERAVLAGRQIKVQVIAMRLIRFRSQHRAKHAASACMHAPQKPRLAG